MDAPGAGGGGGTGDGAYNYFLAAIVHTSDAAAGAEDRFEEVIDSVLLHHPRCQGTSGNRFHVSVLSIR